MAQIQKGTTYITGDQVTAANLNALADSAILLAGAITDQTAKTVPLAADTVLIHSAADTALRKSTLTQVFANATGIPISTGISGLGTGVATALAVNVGSAGAPVVNGGALGTPSGGTVTNLTGTASININGSVGATTPSTVAGTTGFFSSTLFAGGVTTLRGANVPVANNSGFLIVGSSDAAAADLGGSIGFQANTTSLSNYPMGNISARLIATGAGVYRSYMAFATTDAAGTVAERMRLTDTGLNSTAIGATTASTGAFTTLSASTSGSFSGAGLPYAANSLMIRNNGTGDSQLWALGPNTSTYGTITFVVALSDGSSTYGFMVGSNTGLAVTGTLSASGNITGVQGIFSDSISIANSSALYFGGIGSDTYLVGSSASNAVNAVAGGTTVGSFTTTGLAVTGTLSSTTGAELATTGGGNFVKIGSSTAIGSGTGLLEITFNNAYYGQRVKTSNSGGGSVLQILKSTGAEVGLISHNDTVTVYGGTSDYRLKDITGPLIDSGTFIDALKPKVGTWKSNGDKFVGFLAHEFAEVSPTSVTGEKDAVDAEGTPKYQGMQAGTAEVIANLVAELQSLRARVAALESK